MTDLFRSYGRGLGLLVIALTAATMILLDRIYGLDRVLVGKQ